MTRLYLAVIEAKLLKCGFVDIEWVVVDVDEGLLAFRTLLVDYIVIHCNVLVMNVITLYCNTMISEWSTHHVHPTAPGPLGEEVKEVWMPGIENWEMATVRWGSVAGADIGRQVGDGGACGVPGWWGWQRGSFPDGVDGFDLPQHAHLVGNISRRRSITQVLEIANRTTMVEEPKPISTTGSISNKESFYHISRLWGKVQVVEGSEEEEKK